jgi:hypothetical protein
MSLLRGKGSQMCLPCKINLKALTPKGFEVHNFNIQYPT